MRSNLQRAVSQTAPAVALLVATSRRARALDAQPKDPFATPSDSTSTGTEAPPSGCDAIAITTAECAKQNSTMMFVAGGYVVLCVLIIAIWRASWVKKGHGSFRAQFFTPLVVGATGAGLLVGFDPARGDTLRCCLASPVFRSGIFLQESAMARAVVLGALPVILLYTIVVFVSGALKN